VPAAVAFIDGFDLDGYYLFRAIRADRLRRLGRNPEATLAYREAIRRSANAVERAFLTRRRASLDQAG